MALCIAAYIDHRSFRVLWQARFVKSAHQADAVALVKHLSLLEKEKVILAAHCFWLAASVASAVWWELRASKKGIGCESAADCDCSGRRQLERSLASSVEVLEIEWFDLKKGADLL
jgi:hypothetical protein